MCICRVSSSGAVSTAFLFVALILSPNGAVATDLEDCRAQLFHGVGSADIVAADDHCEQAVADDPSSGEARLFRAATRVLRASWGNEVGPDGTRITDSVKEMIDAFGISDEGRNPYDWNPVYPRNLANKIDLPADSPQGDDVQEALVGLLVPAIDESVADLRAISADTVVNLTGLEIQEIADVVGVPIYETSIEIDYGDIKLFESVFLLWKSQLLLVDALDMDDIDLDEYTPIEGVIWIQIEVIDRYPALATLRPNAGASLAEANEANRQAIAAYLAASDFIRNEGDNQDEDLFTIETLGDENEQELQEQLALLRSALDRPTVVLEHDPSDTEDRFIAERAWIEALNSKLGTEFDERGAVLDLGLFYDVNPAKDEGDRFSPRDVMPEFFFDGRNFVRAGETGGGGSFPDKTFRGMLLPVEDLDTDRDGILDDGDGAGTVGDLPCTGGETEACDDNCPLVVNGPLLPEGGAEIQLDADGDGIGDACECGDLNGDGFLNTIDARLMQRCSVGEFPCADLCDVTGEGDCNTIDARLIQRLAVGELTKGNLSCAKRP